MADDRTERATPRKRDDARRRGQVARSMDVNGAVVLIAGLFALSLLGPAVVGAMETSMRDSFERISDPQAALTAGGLEGIAMSTLRTLALAIGPVAAVCAIAGIVANLGQVGLKPSAEALKPQAQRINPLSGARNVFGPRMFFEGAKSIVKVAVIGVIVAMAVAPKMTELSATVGASPGQLAAELVSLVLSISQRAAIAYLVIGAIDYAYQKYTHEKQLRMSMQDVKDEFRSQQLPAEVKSMQRRRMMQQARARMMSAVPDADVVVTNPTHFAVALKYDGTKPAPIVVAKGQDLIALQIRRLAAEHDVPVIENRPLARSLHATVEVGQMIPEDLYQAVAQVLAHVYRVAGNARRKVGAR
ncbi:flagellar biosynthesis protein FlhB [Conexibacter woesei]|uniref:Flagellar biosynthetic protein FlhB n=1 Tax=Conexibacter woesei (strain DSM 14684 / CCUG 47730 / CIP 108061 / JCM 11494 / NBRC 100937 / ID131577) TaxID=469383 RepID=D3F422_CONWI|nr:flagellar biosynthesis protein FlhB [Conexibacter woesei]ADB48505.1 flagellar biosynthetic protein FlhB [Conexibacter woesei DSM 14684]